MESFDPLASCYCLGLEVNQKIRVKVGSLGFIESPPGWIYYVGRATGGWTGRVKRFGKENQTNFWHIDYLVNASGTDLRAIFPVGLPAASECELACCLESFAGFTPLPKRFGASDCSAGCRAHAWTGQVPPEKLFKKIREQNLPLKSWVELTPRKCKLRTVNK